MARLEQALNPRLARARAPAAARAPHDAGLLQRLFRGQLEYVTVCQTRGHTSTREARARARARGGAAGERADEARERERESESESARRRAARRGRDPSPLVATQTEFDGLELNIQGHSTVSGCLKGMLAPETLEGDNQYACERCAARRDARRSIRLRSLPPVLSIQARAIRSRRGKMGQAEGGRGGGGGGGGGGRKLSHRVSHTHTRPWRTARAAAALNLQLMRYVYDRTTWLKKKLKTEIAIEPSIAVPRHRGADGPRRGGRPGVRARSGPHPPRRERARRPLRRARARLAAGGRGGRRGRAALVALRRRGRRAGRRASRADARDPAERGARRRRAAARRRRRARQGQGRRQGREGRRGQEEARRGPAGALGAEPSDAYMLVYVRSDFLREARRAAK